MNTFILKIGCFLTGRNHLIVKNCSEASAKSVKKYLAAILIVSILWGFIGYTFTQRYIKGDFTTSLAVAAVLVFIVIHIERQIILSIGKNRLARAFRVIIGIVMAIIGSVIIDQMLFREDIEKKNISNIQAEVNNILPEKTRELVSQISNLDTTIKIKEAEIKELSKDIEKNPTKIIYNVETNYVIDTLGNRVPTGKKVTTNHIPNPNISRLPDLDAQIQNLIDKKIEKEKNLVTIRDNLEAELKSKTGFLDELIVLFSILFSHGIALFVWLSLFTFFLAIELFVLVNKFGDHQDDYDEVVLHQMDIHKIRLKKLAENHDSKIVRETVEA
ncbi:MAG TPA: DUF4407 domain-containing protein [Candidatus Nitrosotenuis sp.]|nr:DUF4407 domain-containing protein [Candidatus Nitrosotenuis sp.]